MVVCSLLTGGGYRPAQQGDYTRVEATWDYTVEDERHMAVQSAGPTVADGCQRVHEVVSNLESLASCQAAEEAHSALALGFEGTEGRQRADGTVACREADQGRWAR